MAVNRAPRPDWDGLLGRLKTVFEVDDPGAVLSEWMALVTSVTGADAAAVLILDHGRVRQSAWHSVLPTHDAPVRTAVLERLQALVGASDPEAPLARATVGRQAVQAITFSTGPQSHLVLGLVLSARRRPLRGAPLERARALAEALAGQIQRLHESARATENRTRQERWFRRLDEQIQVLDRERQKFAAMVSQTDSYVFVADLACTIRWTNPALNELSALDAADPANASDAGGWIGRPCSALCRQWSEERDHEACTVCPVERALARGETAHAELSPRRADGVGTLYLTALPIKGPDGKPREVMVTIQDLSDLDALRRSETRYRTLFERSADALLMVDPAEKRVLFGNATAGRLFACPANELRGRTLAELHAAGEWERAVARYDEILAAGSAAGLEVVLSARTGQERIAEVRATRLDLGGRSVAMVALHDLTETRRVERSLREAEERLRAVVANSPVVLFAIDPDGTFTLCEGRGLAGLGLRSGELVGRSVFDAFADVPEFHANLDRALAGEEFTEVVRVGAHAFETSYAPQYDELGQLSGVIGVATDVTARRRLEDQLRHSQKLEAVGRLAGGVAHDFNNLLTTILGASEMLVARPEFDPVLLRFAREIQNAGLRGSLLTRQLLAFGRREVLAPRALDVNMVVTDMHEMLHRLVGEDIELVTLFAPGGAIVRADPGQLEQVLMNLVLNARDAMPQGGRLRIEVANVELDPAYCRSHSDAFPGAHVMLAVTDEGCGMDAELQARIFEPFFTTKERGKGTGLGLSITYGIVTQWHGHIAVYSEPGRGSAFKVYLPRANALVEREDDGESEPQPLFRGSETVLLAEDEDSVRVVAREFLELLGYTVLEASDGAVALELAGQHEGRIDLLMTDVVMPRMGGGELGEKLVRERPNLRVLYMSGYADDAVVRHGLLDARAEFLQKPFSLQAFARRVREVLDAPARAQDRAETTRAA